MIRGWSDANFNWNGDSGGWGREGITGVLEFMSWSQVSSLISLRDMCVTMVRLVRNWTLRIVIRQYGHICINSIGGGFAGSFHIQMYSISNWTADFQKQPRFAKSHFSYLFLISHKLTNLLHVKSKKIL